MDSTFISKTSIKTTLQIVCFCGCAVHVSFLMRNYFAYPVIHQVVDFKPEWIKLPAITLCIPHNTSAELALNKTERIFERREDILMNMTLEEFNRLSPAKHEFIKNCSLFQTAEEEQKCDRLTNITTSISIIRKCFTLFKNTNILIERVGLAAQEMARLEVNISRSASSYQYFYLHDAFSDGPNSFTSSNSVELDLKTEVFALISFGSHRREMLPFPYSDCVDFRKKYGLSRDLMLQNCIIDGYFHRLGKFPVGYHVDYEKYKNLSSGAFQQYK